MARKKRRSFRAAFRSIGRRARRAYRRSSKSGGVMQTILGGALYGVARAPVASAITPVTGMLPLGQYNDEVGMAILSWLAAKKGSGILHSVGKAGLTIEAARVASGLTGGLGIGGSSGGAF